MDQINSAIRWMKKNKFWLGCFWMSALMVGIWCFRVFTAIDKETDKNVKNIQQKINTTNQIQRVSAEGVEGTPAHPNTKSEEGIQQEMELTVASIIEAWEKRVNDQKKILKWPSDIIESPAFAETFSRYDPPELIPDTWLQGDGRLGPLLALYAKNIPKQMVVLTGDDLLRTYWNYDPARLEAEERASTQPVGRSSPGRRSNGDDEYGEGSGRSIGGRSIGGNGRSTGGGSRGQAQDTPGFVYDELTGELIDLNSFAVIWDDVNQELWQTKMTSFKGRDDHRLPTNTPTPLQCYMLQQDLWLLEAIFRIIREVNGDADANDISSIKQLHHVVFGRDVGGKLGVLTPFDPLLGAAGDAGVANGDDGGQRFVDDEEEPYGRSGEEDGESPTISPYHHRYVDLNFDPLGAAKVKEIIESPELPPEDLELIVSKRVPVRIAVRMKETEIATFMAACANSPFAFEIQQVRWNRHQKGEQIELGGQRGGGFGGLGTGRSGGGRPSPGRSLLGGGAGGGIFGGGGGSGTSVAPALESTPVEVRTNYDVNVEFYGIVKIYNPVRPKVLQAAAGLEEVEVDPNDAASIDSAKSARSRL